MSTHAILLACTLLGQANASDPPVARENALDRRYGGERYRGQPASEQPIPRRDTAVVVTGDEADVVAQPRSSIGSQFLRDQEIERNRYQTETGVGAGTANAGDADEELWPPRSRVPPAKADLTNPNSPRVAPTPPNDAAGATAPTPRASGVPRPAVDAKTGVDAKGANVAEPAPRTLTPAARPGTPLAEERLPDPRLPDTPAVVNEQESPPGGDDLPRLTAVDDRSETAAILHVTAFFSVPIASSTGVPMTLSEAIGKRSDRESRLRIAHAYWKLATATAAMKIAYDESQRLLGITDVPAGPQHEIDRQLLESEQHAAVARIREATVAFVSAQHDLAESVGGIAGEQLPVVADTPFLGAYATRFDELFADRLAPVQLRAIHFTLPVLRQAIVARAKATVAAAAAIERAEQAYLQRQIGIETYLAAFRSASVQRQAFLAVARAYNDDIADYAINVARDGTGAVELTSMLIRVQRTSSSDAARRTQPPVARAAENPRRGVMVDRSQPAATLGGGTTNTGNSEWEPRGNTPLR